MSEVVAETGAIMHTREDPRTSDKPPVRYLLKSTAQTKYHECLLRVKHFFQESVMIFSLSVHVRMEVVPFKLFLANQGTAACDFSQV